MSEAPAASNGAARWWVQVRGQPYGPYTLEQMARFFAEGRVRQTSFVRDRENGEWAEAYRMPALRGLRQPSFAKDAAGDAANILVHAELGSGAYPNVMATLEALGFVCELSSTLWLVRTRRSASTIRNAMSQLLKPGDRFVVVDATRDRLAWFNLGPEVDVRIAQVWNGPVPLEAANQP
ncbi:MAG: DUF4339 domain-containing protein [Hyphomonadaceae bacterium]|nr:DUF4339 domain-containing protein [Hyphomonadaceae bacterium]